MLISLIVAMDKNRVIGRNGDLPWRLPDDMRWFRKVTMGKPVVMGRKTYDSIGKPLKGRTNIVLTRQRDFLAEGCIVVNSIEDALAAAGETDELVVIGGAAIYEQFLPLVERIYLTEVNAEVDGDTWFVELSAENWHEQSRTHHPADKKHTYPFDIVTLQRTKMIYHIITPRAWHAAQEAGIYQPPSLENEGFIHFSEREQVARVVASFYAHEPELLVLQVDTGRLEHDVIYERAADHLAEMFPHLYGALNLDAVVDVLDYSADF